MLCPYCLSADVSETENNALADDTIEYQCNQCEGTFQVTTTYGEEEKEAPPWS